MDNQPKKRKFSDVEFASYMQDTIKRQMTPKKVKQIRMENTHTEVKDTGLTSDGPPGQFASISDDLPELSVGGMKLLLRICKELVYDNYLWYFDHAGKKNYKVALQELRRKKIIIRSRRNIHAINPLMVRKGHVARVTDNTRMSIALANGFCKEAIISNADDPDDYFNRAVASPLKPVSLEDLMD